MEIYKPKDRWSFETLAVIILGMGRNRWQVTQVVTLATFRNGFEVFSIATGGNADTGDLALLRHIHSLLFFYNGIIGKLIPGDSATLFDKPNDCLALEFACGI